MSLLNHHSWLRACRSAFPHTHRSFPRGEPTFLSAEATSPRTHSTVPVDRGIAAGRVTGLDWYTTVWRAGAITEWSHRGPGAFRTIHFRRLVATPDVSGRYNCVNLSPHVIDRDAELSPPIQRGDWSVVRTEWSGRSVLWRGRSSRADRD